MSTGQQKQAFRDALSSRDPYRVAQILDLPPISPQKQGAPRTHKETLQDADGVDWSNVLSSWLVACDSANKVRKRWHVITVTGDDSANVIFSGSPGRRHQVL